jgi:hypothetical protein
MPDAIRIMDSTSVDYTPFSDIRAVYIPGQVLDVELVIDFPTDELLLLERQKQQMYQRQVFSSSLSDTTGSSDSFTSSGTWQGTESRIKPGHVKRSHSPLNMQYARLINFLVLSGPLAWVRSDENALITSNGTYLSGAMAHAAPRRADRLSADDLERHASFLNVRLSQGRHIIGSQVRVV